MRRRLAYLAALVLTPWLAVAGAMVVTHELLTRHRVLWAMAGCTALLVAFEVGTVTYRLLKTRPTPSRAEAVRRLERRGWHILG